MKKIVALAFIFVLAMSIGASPRHRAVANDVAPAWFAQEFCSSAQAFAAAASIAVPLNPYAATVTVVPTNDTPPRFILFAKSGGDAVPPPGLMWFVFADNTYDAAQSYLLNGSIPNRGMFTSRTAGQSIVWFQTTPFSCP